MTVISGSAVNDSICGYQSGSQLYGLCEIGFNSLPMLLKQISLFAERSGEGHVWKREAST